MIKETQPTKSNARTSVVNQLIINSVNKGFFQMYMESATCNKVSAEFHLKSCYRNDHLFHYFALLKSRKI